MTEKKRAAQGCPKWFILLLYALFLFLMVFVISLKSGYHIDEVFSYGLANTEIYLQVTPGVVYTPADFPYADNVTVAPDGRFNYRNVWNNQASDVHPPFYYVILHTICSFFPGQFSRWFAGSINIFFALLTLFVICRIMRLFQLENYAVNIISLGFICSYGILNAVAFFRMYIMAMFWCALLTYLLLKKITDEHAMAGVRFYLFAAAVIYAGAMTHYYCIMYAAFLSLAYCISLLTDGGKFFRRFAAYCASATAAAIASIATFPTMLDHMFSGYRGKEALSNLHDSPAYLSRWRQFLGMLNQEMFGGLLLVFLGVILTAVIFRVVRHKRHEADNKVSCCDKCHIRLFLVSGAAVLLTFIFIASTASYITPRYIYILYPVAYVWAATLLYLVWRRYSSRIAAVLLSCFLGAAAIVGCVSGKWGYLYSSNRAYNQSMEEYTGLNCISFYSADKIWKLSMGFGFMQPFHSAVYLPEDQADLLNESPLNSDERVVVYFETTDGTDQDNHSDSEVKALLAKCPQWTTYQDLHNPLFKAYLLSR